MSKSLNDLEYLLQRKDNINEDLKSRSPEEEARKLRDSLPLKADKSADIHDFITMVSKVVTLAMKEDKVEFVPDEGKRLVIDPTQPIDHPYILYKVISRVPKMERKARERESFISEDTYLPGEGRKGRIYGQKFKAYIQFDIIASEYSAADRVMNNFEDLILSYSHFFKKNGVAELLFEKHYTDENLDIYRESISVRSLQYYVELEKLTMIYDSEIKEININ